ncbi:MAG TPA: carboxypeptidase-like regulatory domain-containing protein, partial [Cyclobacteriaceae bacterium]|nr:carboxypeptidase-like regulatory domain-containing protein [Cyclobacteriaceae bacterium]
MKKTIPHKYLLVLIILFSYSGGSWAQNIQVTGSVLENGSDLGIPGVNILIKSTSRGTVTDLDGKFAIEVPNGQTLVFSSIGFQNQEITIGPNTPSPLTVVLEESATDLGEVVVTGYGAQSKKTISSTVTSVNAAELKEIPVPSPDQLLQGKAAGVQVSAGSGIPGGGIFVRVRGTTSINAGNNPLYIIDGVFINNQNLSTASLGGQSTNPLA